MKKKIAVVGTGTAGIVSLSFCLSHIPSDWEVHSVYDPSIPILGIGESTQSSIPHVLYEGARFTLLKDAHELDATIKHGVKYVGWRNHDIFTNILPPSHAMHFNNFKLKEFCFRRFKDIWKDKFFVCETKVLDIVNEESCAKIITNEKDLKYDYVIDCRGYPENYTEYNIEDSILVNHCLVHTIKTPGNWNWTYHIAHRNGWMFGIPLMTRQGWGYLYNDTITEKSDAIDDISERFKIKKEELNLKEFSFKNYSAKKFIDHRIIKNGNRALFLEPIEAMSGMFYDGLIRNAFDVIFDFKTEDDANKIIIDGANFIVTFISFIYHGGSLYDSSFWKMAKEKCNFRLSKDDHFNMCLNHLKNKNIEDRTKRDGFGMFTTPSWVDFDKQFMYNYITNKEESLEW